MEVVDHSGYLAHNSKSRAALLYLHGQLLDMDQGMLGMREGNHQQEMENLLSDLFYYKSGELKHDTTSSSLSSRTRLKINSTVLFRHLRHNFP